MPIEQITVLSLRDRIKLAAKVAGKPRKPCKECQKKNRYTVVADMKEKP